MFKIDLNRIWNDEKKFTYFFFVNICFLFCGIAALSVGIFLYSSKNNFVELTPSAYSALSAAGLCVFSGVTICIIVGIGYMGVSWGNKPLLYAYIAFLILLIVVHGVSRTTGFFHRVEARDNLRHFLRRAVNMTSVVTKVGVELKLQFTWDHLQRELECCGVDGYSDWYYSVHWPSSQYAPDSCCDPAHFQANATMENCGKMPDDASVLYQEGCFPKFAEWLYDHIILVNWVTSILFFVEVILFVLSIAVLIVLRGVRNRRRPTPRESREPDVASDRIRLNSMDRIGDAHEDPVEDVASINSR